MRWQHPLRGLLLPEKFLPIAMDTGLVRAIDEWVAANSLWAQSSVAAVRQEAGAHFHQCLPLIVPRQYSTVCRGRDAPSNGVGAGVPGVGTGGVGRDAQGGCVDRSADYRTGYGGTDLHRRLWDWLLVAQLRASFADQQGEDQSIVHPGNPDADPPTCDCAVDHCLAHSLDLFLLAKGSSRKLNERSYWMRGATLFRGISLGGRCRRTRLLRCSSQFLSAKPVSTVMPPSTQCSISVGDIHI